MRDEARRVKKKSFFEIKRKENEDIKIKKNEDGSLSDEKREKNWREFQLFG